MGGLDRMQRALMGRGARFSLVGLLCTAASYGAFVGLTPLVGYGAANVMAWAAGFLLSFALNRGFTYRIRGSHRSREQFGLFLLGSAAQLGIASAGYWLLIGRLHMNTSAAFAINLVFTAAFMFAYMECVAFGRRMRPE